MDREFFTLIALVLAALVLIGVLFVASKLDSGVNIGGRFITASTTEATASTTEKEEPKPTEKATEATKETTKATETEEYQTYLQNRGADKTKHYFLKVDATKLLMENIENTFVTSVFNGSASLRNAAGELIEETKKAGRRGDVIDNAYMDELFQKMSAQYHLDQIVPDPTKIASGDMLALPRNVNGPLPAEAVILLAALGVTWLSIGIYCFFQWRKKKISSQNH